MKPQWGTWNGRDALNNLAREKLADQFSPDTEIWIDGGHNAGAGEVIAREIEQLNSRHPKSLTMISAMLTTKDPKKLFLTFFEIKTASFYGSHFNF